ncbi:MAG: hypothetical protein ACI976_002992 [Aureispira sp.]|jgi:hypothetical protein
MIIDIKGRYFLLFFLVILSLFKCRKDDIDTGAGTGVDTIDTTGTDTVVIRPVLNYTLYGGNFYCRISGSTNGDYAPIGEGTDYNYDRILDVRVDTINDKLIFDGKTFSMTSENQRTFTKISRVNVNGIMETVSRRTLIFYNANYDSISYSYYYSSPWSYTSTESRDINGGITSLPLTGSTAPSNLIGNYVLDIHKIDSYNNIDTQYVATQNVTRSGGSIHADSDVLAAGVFHSYFNYYKHYIDNYSAYNESTSTEISWTANSFSYNRDYRRMSAQGTDQILNRFVGPRL